MALIPDFATRVISFADFQVDLRAGELRHNGAKIKLQNQPLQILTMLLEHPGEIVTRDEMRARLWPAETFVDFDHGLNSAVRRLRDALGDSADRPVYIETVGRRGYRFAFPVEHNNGNNNNGKDGGYLAAKVPISSVSSKPISYAPTLGSTRSLDWKGRLLIAAGVLLVVGLFFTNGNHIGQSSLGQWLRRIAPGSRSESPMVTQRQLTANPQEVPVTSAALSPDGKYLTYTDKTGVYVRQISTGETHPIELRKVFTP
jgi:DNA-binding winged helix-turn-helix (wHTH) protein